MAFSSLLLLPGLALILLIQGTWLKNADSHWIRSDSYKRNLKAKVLIHRALIVSLIVATAVAFMSPYTQLPGLLQGLVVTLILMLPVLLYLWLVKLKASAEKPALNEYEKLRRDKDRGFSDHSPRTARDVDTANKPTSKTASIGEDFQARHLNRPTRVSQASVSTAGKSNRVSSTVHSASANASPKKASPSKASPSKASPSKASPYNVRPINASPADLSLTNVSPTRVSLTDRAPVDVSPIDMSAIDASTVDVLLTSVNNANVLEISGSETTKAKHKPQYLANKTLDVHGDAPLYEEAGSMLDETLQFDMTLSMEEQLYNIDNSIEYIDIGVDESANNDDTGSPEKAEVKNSDDQALNVTLKKADTELALHTEKQETMPAVLYSELTKKLSVLQKDKTRLQKLVIAQKALIDTEVLSRKKSQVMAKDAMTILRRVREGERATRKIARNEQRKRQRLEADNAALAKQLKNALSTRRIKEDSEF